MKAYNKKGLITGTIFCVIGAFSLIKNLTVPSDLMILQIRNIVISFLAFKLKSLCSAFVILQALIFICVILSMIAFYFTENILTVAILIVLGLLLSISWIIELITTIYYEKKQQGEEF